MSEGKRPIGRPTNYRPEYCEMLLEHMAKGLSFESFAGALRTNKKVIYEWAEKHEDFGNAKEQAFELSRIFYEKAGVEGLWNAPGQKQLNNTAWVFNMKNRFGWADKSETTETSEIKIIIESQDQDL